MPAYNIHSFTNGQNWVIHSFIAYILSLYYFFFSHHLYIYLYLIASSCFLFSACYSRIYEWARRSFFKQFVQYIWGNRVADKLSNNSRKYSKARAYNWTASSVSLTLGRLQFIDKSFRVVVLTNPKKIILEWKYEAGKSRYKPTKTKLTKNKETTSKGKKELCFRNFSTTGTKQFYRGCRVLYTIIVHTKFYMKTKKIGRKKV